MNWLLMKAWRAIRGKLQWHVLWWSHAKFVVSVTGIVKNKDNEILLLRHRFWPEGSWGMPGGFINKSETLEAALRREVKEETRLEIDVGPIVQVNGGFRFRVETCLLATVREGILKANEREILEAKFFPPDQLPEGLIGGHRKWIQLHGGKISEPK
jgi:8-oxo-dGTP diphosphatase